jgi:TIR domain
MGLEPATSGVTGRRRICEQTSAVTRASLDRDILPAHRDPPMDVFLSYSSRDQRFVGRLAEQLRNAGLDVWLDEAELRVGDSLDEIENSIRQARSVVVALSETSKDSDWVAKEIGFARDAGVRVLAILLDDVPPWEAVFADFRDRTRYRRTVAKLVHSIKGLPNPRLPRAKDAVLRIRKEFPLAGELFGVSQQGVGTLYHLANRHDWLFADATVGESRLWIVEMYQRRERSVYPFAIVDGVVHELPVLTLLDSDRELPPEAAIVYSCALNHESRISEEEAREIVEKSSTMRPVKRYTPFRPVPIIRNYIDSDDAVAAAVQSAAAKRLFGERAQEVFTLTKLECDKRHGNVLLWTISFFDESLGDSVLTVGVDAVTGAVRYPVMRAEILNADFLTMRYDENRNIVMSMANQMRAIDSHLWDVAPPGQPTRLTFADAVHRAMDHLGEDRNRWQLGFVSNTGVVRSVIAQYLAPHDGLMRVDGTAGQWVVELFGTNPTRVQEEDRSGFLYDYRVLMITHEEGVREVEEVESCGMRSPLEHSPLPPRFFSACRDIYDEAHALALQSVNVDFEAMSVAFDRPPGGARWRFRFYDKEEVVARVWLSADGTRVIGPE